MANKVWFITGTSKGFGRVWAEAALARGDRVAATARDVKTLDPLGEPFDPSRHEAMMAQPSTSAEPNSILKVVQNGYELNGRLLRPARVIIAKAP